MKESLDVHRSRQHRANERNERHRDNSRERRRDKSINRHHGDESGTRVIDSILRETSSESGIIEPVRTQSGRLRRVSIFGEDIGTTPTLWQGDSRDLFDSHFQRGDAREANRGR
jgi:hypothetical protein